MAFRHHPPHSSWCFIYSCNLDNPDYRIISQNCLVSSCVSVCQTLTPSSFLPAKLASASHPLRTDSDLTSFEKPSWMPPCNSHSIVGALSDRLPPQTYSVLDFSDLSLDREQLDGWDGAFSSLNLASAQGLASPGWESLALN